MKNQKLRRKHVTLIEVLIASFLAMILLSAIAFFYRQVTLMDKESEKLQKEQFKLAYLEKRLSNIIPKIISPTDPHKDFYFFTSNNLTPNGSLSLIFTYDRKVNYGAELSNHQLGRLFIDEDKNLILASFAAPKPSTLNSNLKMEKEILLENVSELTFEFYVPPKKDRSKIVNKSQHGIEISPENAWHKTWSYRTHELPAMMKIHLIKKIENQTIPVTFAFSLPKSNLVVMYDN